MWKSQNRPVLAQQKWFWPDISAEAEQILTPGREESVMNVMHNAAAPCWF
jgi:VanZ family protein